MLKITLLHIFFLYFCNGLVFERGLYSGGLIYRTNFVLVFWWAYIRGPYIPGVMEGRVRAYMRSFKVVFFLWRLTEILRKAITFPKRIYQNKNKIPKMQSQISKISLEISQRKKFLWPVFGGIIPFSKKNCLLVKFKQYWLPRELIVFVFLVCKGNESSLIEFFKQSLVLTFERFYSNHLK